VKKLFTSPYSYYKPGRRGNSGQSSLDFQPLSVSQSGELIAACGNREVALARRLGADTGAPLLRAQGKYWSAKAAEICAMFSNQLGAKCTAEIRDRTLAAGLSI
jgi:hypothetical protein